MKTFSQKLINWNGTVKFSYGNSKSANLNGLEAAKIFKLVSYRINI